MPFNLTHLPVAMPFNLTLLPRRRVASPLSCRVFSLAAVDTLDEETRDTIRALVDPVDKFFREKVDSGKIDKESRIPPEVLDGLKARTPAAPGLAVLVSQAPLADVRPPHGPGGRRWRSRWACSACRSPWS